MRIHHAKPLFAWDCLDDNPSLKTIRDALKAIPDGRLLEGLRAWRGKGRNDYPVHCLWGVLLLTMILRHASIDACLAELRRNPELRKLIGIETESQVPDSDNISRFQKVLGQEPHRTELRKIFDSMITRLGEVVPDLGQDTAGDSTTLNARRSEAIKKLLAEKEAAEKEAAEKQLADKQTADKQTVAKQAVEQDAAEKQSINPPDPVGDPKPTNTPATDATPEKAADKGAADVVETEDGLPLPSGGRKEYRDDSGKVTKVVEWFGYKGHLLVDVKHEVVLSWEITSTKTPDNEMISPLIQQAKSCLTENRIQTLAYDKASDDVAIHELLRDEDIKPVIEIRRCWKNQTEMLVPGQEQRGNIVHDEAGTLFCVDTKSEPPVRHKMAYMGHEASRGTLKYRCPAKHEGWTCPMSPVCNAGKTYGLTVRVKQETDLRRFPPIPRGTKKFEELYDGRTAVERANARLKVFWGADDGNVVGASRFHAFFALVMIVHATFATLLATAPRHGGVLNHTRLSTISQALHRKIDDEE